MRVKYLKFGKYEVYAGAIILFASGLRILLAALGWPPTNSDEGTMGIMARHIAYKGEHPLLFYGQNYMGSLEAYLGALFFHVFGPTLFALRLGVILLVTLFFITMYLLTSLLYSKQLALVTLAFLSIGSIPEFTRQIIATGGSSQTLLFGSLAFLLASWFSLTYRRGAALKTKLLRLLGYCGWGVVIGLGLWSDMVVLPTFALAGLLLLVFCWRDLLWAWIGVLAGVIVGALPLIDYNLKAGKGQSSVTTLLKLFHGTVSKAPTTLHGVLHGVKATILVSVPTATGSPYCPVMELTFLGDNSPHTPLCTVAHAAWGGGYLILLAVALFFILRGLWRLGVQEHWRLDMRAIDTKQAVVRSCAQLALLGSALLAITVFAVSEAPTNWPGFHARYLIGLLIVTPAILAPLWSAASTFKPHLPSLERMKIITSRGALAAVAISLLIGTGILFSEVPRAQAANQSEARLIHDLLSIGANHIYSDYWTCDSISFVSRERIICGAIGDGNGLQRYHDNRVAGYYSTVSSDPNSAYVLPKNYFALPLLEQEIKNSKRKYRHFIFEGYSVYQPIKP